MAHAPLTIEAFRTLAPLIARQVHRVKNLAKKVIVLDCDNTLWGGAVGEKSARGVDLSHEFLSLQRFFVEQFKRGMLICLCSRNIEDDVLAVFREREKEMLLTLDHVVGIKANWKPKSENITELVTELSLAMDSVIFVDDNPVECAQVESHCPGVTCVHLPPDTSSFASFLKETWVFDSPISQSNKTTKEDVERTDMYRKTFARNKMRSAFSTFSAFMASLNLWMDFSPMDTESIERVAQLTERTNQFNVCKQVLCAGELEQLETTNTHQVYTVTSGDRFCRHGVVGVFFIQQELRQVHLHECFPSLQGPSNVGRAQLCVATTEADKELIICDFKPKPLPLQTQSATCSCAKHSVSCLNVPVFLLSCRTLHLGIEHAMLRHIADTAKARGAEYISIAWTPSERNEPARRFLFSLAPLSSSAPIYFAPASTDSRQVDQSEAYNITPQEAPQQVYLSHPNGIKKPDGFDTAEWEALSKNAKKKVLKKLLSQRCRELGVPRCRNKKNNKASPSRHAPQISTYKTTGDNTKPPAGMLFIPVDVAASCALEVDNPCSKIVEEETNKNRTQAANSTFDHQRPDAFVTGSGYCLHSSTYTSIATALASNSDELRTVLLRHQRARAANPLEDALSSLRVRNQEDTQMDEGTRMGEVVEDDLDTIDKWRKRYQGRQKVRHEFRKMLQQNNPDSNYADLQLSYHHGDDLLS